MRRVILHVDMNNFYASVECFLHPDWNKNMPIAVCGDAEKRHGIILAKNEPAKKKGVTTGEPIWQAEQKCPGLKCVSANYHNYTKFSTMARQIFLRYTGKMEPFGLDEAWLDISGKNMDMERGRKTADEIRAVITRELGITASVGVSYNKIFAKLGSDMKKPNATTVVPQERFREMIWNLPAGDLLYVGKSTQKKLERRGINTIGDIARCDMGVLRRMLGKWGEILWNNANGYNADEVASSDEAREIKSIGNSTTTPRDLVSVNDVRQALTALSENVAMRLKKYQRRAACIQISLRFHTLERMTRQRMLSEPTDLSIDILQAAMGLFSSNCDLSVPIRSIGVRASELIDLRERQMDFFIDQKKIQAERAMETIRARFGKDALIRASVLAEKDLTELEEGKRSIFPHSNL
ncbi:MAG: DNA polymerase IV [Christensenella sp.]|nr:DNA polymerase IV [Christensenella sp.]